MPLTDTAIRRAKSGGKPTRLFDGGGLYLEVSPAGAKLWRLKYRFNGKEKRLALGIYPDVSLAKARDKRDEARKLLASGIDPGEHRKAVKNIRAGLAANTFEVIGREWYSKTAPTLADSTGEKLLRRLEADVYPWIGHRPIADLVAADLIKVIERIEQRGAVDIAKRVHNSMGRIFRYAVGRSLASRDPSRDIELKDILPPADVQHHASVTDPKAVGGLLRAIDGFTGAFATRCAMQPCCACICATRRTSTCSVDRIRLRQIRVAHPGRNDEDERAAHRAAVRSGRRHPAGDSTADRRRALRVPKRARRWPSDEREHHQCGAAAHGIRQRRNDGARLPQHGIHPVARTRLVPCGDRAAVGAQRAQQGVGCKQLCGVPARAAEDDAAVGGLSRQDQDRG